MIIFFFFFLFCSIFVRNTLSFHLHYKILSPKKLISKSSTSIPIYNVNYLCRVQNGYTCSTKNRVLSFFSRYFENKEKKFELNKEEKKYLQTIGADENTNYGDLVKLHEAFIENVNDIKNKLRYKDLFFFILQKIIHKSLNDFKKKQKYKLFKDDEYTCELSVNYVKNSNIEEKFKEILIRKLNSENKRHFFFLNIFKWKNLSEVFAISRLMIPFSALGFAMTKMSIFSIAVNLIITAHFLTYRKDKKKKLTFSTFLLTLFPILLHSCIGLICTTLFFKNFRLSLPHFLQKENILSLFVNSQLYLAALIYFTNISSDEDTVDDTSDVATSSDIFLDENENL